MSNPWKLLFVGFLVCGCYSISSASSESLNVPGLPLVQFLGDKDINIFQNLIKSVSF